MDETDIFSRPWSHTVAAANSDFLVREHGTSHFTLSTDVPQDSLACRFIVQSSLVFSLIRQQFPRPWSHTVAAANSDFLVREHGTSHFTLSTDVPQDSLACRFIVQSSLVFSLIRQQFPQGSFTNVLYFLHSRTLVVRLLPLLTK